MDKKALPLSPMEQPTQEDPNVHCQAQEEHGQEQGGGEPQVEVNPKEEQEQKEQEPDQGSKNDKDTEDYFKLSPSGSVMTFTRYVSTAQQLADLIRGIGSQARQLVTTLNVEYTDYDDDTPKLDLDLNLDLLLPALQSLRLNGVAWCNFNLKSASLLYFEIENPIPGSDGKFAFRFPNLLSFDSQFLHLEDSSDFAASLSASPKLERLSSYKLWGLGSQPTWYLPSCTVINMSRSDDLTRLKLYCPRLEELGLRACYGISSVTLLKR